MAYINSADPSFTILEEVTPGVTPGVGSRYALPVSTDQVPPVFSTATVASNTKHANRGAGGTQQGLASVSWSLATRLQRAPFMDSLLKAAMSGTWVSNKLNAGATDTFHSIISELRTDTAVSPASPNGLYYVDKGVIPTSMSISTSSGEGANITFEFLGIDRAEAFAKHATTVTTVPTSAREFYYADLKNVKLTAPGGVKTLGVSSLELSHTPGNREIRAICGQIEGVGVGTAGAHETTLTIKVYRESFDLNADVTGEPQLISFEIGEAGNGYRFTLPAATGQKPTDEISGSSLLASIVFTASQDQTLGTDFFVEKI